MERPARWRSLLLISAEITEITLRSHKRLVCLSRCRVSLAVLCTLTEAAEAHAVGVAGAGRAGVVISPTLCVALWASLEVRPACVLALAD